MTAKEMWEQFLELHPEINQEMDAWAFGAKPDQLAQLVLEDTKTATASAYDLYEVNKDPLPEVGTYDVVLDSQDSAICIIQIKKVSVVPFNQVSADHAFKEGEGDRSLEWWSQAHDAFFKSYFEEINLTFTQDSKIVLEEFEVVYPQKEVLK